MRGMPRKYLSPHPASLVPSPLIALFAEYIASVHTYAHILRDIVVRNNIGFRNTLSKIQSGKQVNDAVEVGQREHYEMEINDCAPHPRLSLSSRSRDH